MFAHISGVVAEKNADSIVIDAGGIGFLLNVSAATLSAAPATGEKFKLYTIFNVREDAMELCGFATREEKRMYERLRSVGGVGSKLALSVLSSLSVHDLSVALVTGDAAALCRVPGIGKKLAQRLVLELKDKVTDEELTSSGPSVSVRPAADSAETEAIEALMALGYPASDAAKAVSAVAGQAAKTDEILRLALRGMTGGR